MVSPDHKGWWRKKGLMFIALAAVWTSGVVPAVGWKPAFLAMGLAVFSADCALGWIKPPRWKALALTATALVSIAAEFGPRTSRLFALLALFAFWGVSLWRNSEPGTIV
jgi:hypothetical protein